MLSCSRCIHRVLDCIVSKDFYESYIKLPGLEVPPEIQENTKLFPFFKDCLRAIDGTHIKVNPPAAECARYHNRKTGTSTNVLAACTFDMHFCYVLSGWEGSAADGLVFEDARKHTFTIPKGKYYLADAGFGTCDALLVPYCGVCYHLKEWAAVKDWYVLSLLIK